MGRPWRELVWVFLLSCGCASTRGGGGAAAPLAPIHGLTGVPAQYFPAFDALRAAVDAHENATARRILERTLIRMAGQRANNWDDMSTGERRAQDSADALAAGFGRILDGRERVEALQLSLIVEAAEAEDRLVLVVRSGWPEPLELRPGPATLREEMVWITPLGRETRTVRYLGLAELDAFEVRGDRPWRRVVASVPAAIPAGALAARQTWSLVLRAGAVLEQGARYPGMHWAVESAERTRIANVLPDPPVEPAELVDYLSRIDLTLARTAQILPPIMERAVRIEPARHGETLALLRPLVERATNEKIERMIPALRWLARSNSAGADPAAWRRWILSHAGGEAPPYGAELDLPERVSR